MVLFPKPEGPTIAVDSPALILKLTFVNIFLCSFYAVGYLNETFLNSIEFERVKSSRFPPVIFGFLSMTSKIVLPTIFADWTA
jgi:hypothetical protein